MVFLQYLTTVFDNIDDAVFLIGVEPHAYRLLTANAAFTRDTGHAEDVMGQTIDSLVPPEAFATFDKRCRQAIKTRRPVEYTNWYESPRSRQLFAIKLIPITNAVGECVQIAGIAHNITAIHHLKEQCHEAAETLEQVAYNLRQP